MSIAKGEQHSQGILPSNHCPRTHSFFIKIIYLHDEIRLVYFAMICNDLLIASLVVNNTSGALPLNCILYYLDNKLYFSDFRHLLYSALKEHHHYFIIHYILQIIGLIYIKPQFRYDFYCIRKLFKCKQAYLTSERPL